MATIKSYSDLEQSRKLADILPLESADMGYLWNGTSFCDYPVSNQTIFNRIENIPCWSLASLLGVLPLVDFTTPQLIGTPKTLYRCIYNDNLKSHAYDNPVDACVAMIEKLHELNFL